MLNKNIFALRSFGPWAHKPHIDDLDDKIINLEEQDKIFNEKIQDLTKQDEIFGKEIKDIKEREKDYVKKVNDQIPDENGQVFIGGECSVITSSSVTPKDDGVLIDPSAIKTELKLNLEKTKIISGEVFIHNLFISLSEVDLGNEISATISITIPEDVLTSKDDSFIALCDSGGNLYGTGFMNYKARTGELSIKGQTITIPCSFYANSNYPGTVSNMNFGDVRVKFI